MGNRRFTATRFRKSGFERVKQVMSYQMTVLIDGVAIQKLTYKRVCADLFAWQICGRDELNSQ